MKETLSTSKHHPNSAGLLIVNEDCLEGRATADKRANFGRMDRRFRRGSIQQLVPGAWNSLDFVSRCGPNGSPPESQIYFIVHLYNHDQCSRLSLVPVPMCSAKATLPPLTPSILLSVKRYMVQSIAWAAVTDSIHDIEKGLVAIQTLLWPLYWRHASFFFFSIRQHCQFGDAFLHMSNTWKR